MPKPDTQCRIRVADTVAHWEEGKSLFFDDTYKHEVWNDTDGLRVVLFMDVRRPVRFPLWIINRGIIKAIAASPFITGPKKNHEEWEANDSVMALIWNGRPLILHLCT